MSADLLIGLILFVLALGVSLPAFYMGLAALASWFYHAPSAKDAPPMRLLVIVPAHNEESGIGATVRSVLACDYPEGLFGVLVLADNCSDATASQAREAGAQVLERHDFDNRGKGQALDWLLRSQRACYKDFEGLIFVDADTSVDAAFLTHISATLACEGVRALQCRYDLTLPDTHWRTCLGFAGFAGVNHVRGAGTAALGGSVTLKGNGMAFERALLEETGWPAHGLVEDMEFSIQLMTSGHSILYQPQAIVRAAPPSKEEAAVSQRMRWEGGRLELMAKYPRRIVPLLVKHFNRRNLFLLAEVCTPPLTLHVTCYFVLILLALAAASFWNVLVLGAGLMCLLFYLVTALLQSHAPASVWRALVLAPFFVLWKLSIYLGLMLRGIPKTWNRTGRDSE